MQTMQRLLLVLASILALSVSIEAKTTTLTKEDHGVLGVMRREGCNPNYFPEVLRQSRILESQLKNLPEGTSIVIPDECQNNSPAREDVKTTQQILKNQSILENAHEISKTNIKLTSDISVARATINELSNAYTRMMVDMNGQIFQLRKNLETEKRGRIFANRWNFSLSAVLILIVVWLLISQLQPLIRIPRFRLIKKNSPVPKREREIIVSAEVTSSPVMFHGEMYDFPDASQRWVACPIKGCGTLVRPGLKSQLAHLVRHPHLRLKWVTPAEARRVLNLTR